MSQAERGTKMEYIRNLHSNYLRSQLEEKPEEQSYRYRIISRGGISGLLDCELRYLNEDAFLYYDITSKQSVAQFFARKTIGREWLRDFMYFLQSLHRELDRFLLDEQDCMWNPEYIFQDLDKKAFYLVYEPYRKQESKFTEFLEFLIEHLDYEDDVLVECVYHMYEQADALGDIYLQEQIFADMAKLENVPECKEEAESAEDVFTEIPLREERTAYVAESRSNPVVSKEDKKAGLWALFESRRKRDRQEREKYRQEASRAMNGLMVAEEGVYCEEEESVREECGSTVYVENIQQERCLRRLISAEGDMDCVLSQKDFIIGKKKGEVDLVLSDASVSRIHARIVYDGEYYLEDMNSTNGTFKNGLRLLPYEKRILQSGDEVAFGKKVMIFR